MTKTITEETIDIVGALVKTNGPGALYGILSVVESTLFTEATADIGEFEAGKLESLAVFVKALKQDIDEVAGRLAWET